MKKICVLIPAYNPDCKLSLLIEQLCEYFDRSEIIVVNDGSNSDEYFKSLPVKVLSHSVNLGKGEALKNGFKYIVDNIKDCTGIVTADCDFQHLPEDIINIAEYLKQDSMKLYIGVRVFEYKKVPFKSFLGNRVASFLMNVLHGIKLKDTQTGLRGIPLEFAKMLIDVNVSGFAYETEMLIKAKNFNLVLVEIPIKTVYTKNNNNTHFKAFADSIKVLGVIFGK